MVMIYTIWGTLIKDGVRDNTGENAEGYKSLYDILNIIAEYSYWWWNTIDDSLDFKNVSVEHPDWVT